MIKAYNQIINTLHGINYKHDPNNAVLEDSKTVMRKHSLGHDKEIVNYP